MQGLILHIHSTASDGTHGLRQVVAATLAAGLGAIAQYQILVTAAVKANVAATRDRAYRRSRIHLFPVRRSVRQKDDFCFHITGYGIDMSQNKRLLDLLEHNRQLFRQPKDE